jgi:large subunit ribosomal protein L22
MGEFAPRGLLGQRRQRSRSRAEINGLGEELKPWNRGFVKYIRIAPRKVRLVADNVKGKPVEQALNVLTFTPKKAARHLLKVLKSAVANAEQNPSVDVDTLFVKKIWVDEGPTLKRWRARAQGRAYRINKRTSHVTIVLDES